MTTKERRYDIDWLRVLAFYLLILYHAARFFNTGGWHVKNSVISETFDYFIVLSSQFRLPLLFFISGVAVRFALGFRSSWQFIKERHIRLFLPLFFGMLVIVPPQIYFERLVSGVEYQNYFHFWGTVFDFHPYPQGNFSWHHLWYLMYIFTYSIICLPLFLFFRSEKSKPIINAIEKLVKKPGMILLFAVPLALVFGLLAIDWPTAHNLISDWYNFSYSLIFFLTGYIVCSSKNIWNIIVEQRKIFLYTALTLTTFLYLFSWTPVYELFTFEGFDTYIYGLTKSVNVLSIIFAAVGFAKAKLNKPSPFLKYANESVYPFYIAHQTITLTVGYYIKDWEMNLFFKFLLLAAITFAGCFLVYELIKRLNITRIFFGLKLKTKKASLKLSKEKIETGTTDYLTQGSK